MLLESINDKGLFKALFIVGIPYAGKSYVASQISGGVEPRIVNTDRPFEFLGLKNNIPLDQQINQDIKRVLVDKSKVLNRKSLYNYINGMLPLIIDGTSSNLSLIQQRIGTLKYFGYDVAILFVDTDLETALSRMSKRERYVGEDVIRRIFEKHEQHKEYLQADVAETFSVENTGTLSDDVIKDAYNKAQSFFMSDVKNPVGQDHIKDLKRLNKKYLTDIISSEEISTRLSVWYSK